MDESEGEESDTPLPQQLEWRLPSTFAVLSLQESAPDLAPEVPPALLSGTGEEADVEQSGRRRRRHRSDRLVKPKAPLWHFGIRSVAPPMEVMLELYKSLQALGIEWREKRGPWIADAECCSSDDGFREGLETPRASTKDDLDIYTVELRWRKRDVVVSCFALHAPIP